MVPHFSPRKNIKIQTQSSCVRRAMSSAKQNTSGKKRDSRAFAGPRRSSRSAANRKTTGKDPIQNIDILYYNTFFFNKKARFVNFTEAVLRESVIRRRQRAEYRQKEKAYSALRRRAEALNTHPLSQTPPITGRRGSAPPTATRRTGCRLRSLPRANCRWRRPRRSSRLLRRIGYSSTASA